MVPVKVLVPDKVVSWIVPPLMVPVLVIMFVNVDKLIVSFVR
jgi:hypothetical protein